MPDSILPSPDAGDLPLALDRLPATHPETYDPDDAATAYGELATAAWAIVLCWGALLALVAALVVLAQSYALGGVR